MSKTSGTFRINHPDPTKTATKYLQHSLVESPTRGDNIYRYVVCAVGCAASLQLPSYYKFLNENDQVWVTPKSHFGAGYGVVDATQSCVTFTTNADGEYNVLIIGTRKDIDAMNGLFQDLVILQTEQKLHQSIFKLKNSPPKTQRLSLSLLRTSIVLFIFKTLQET
jgi:hypothetical protein